MSAADGTVLGVTKIVDHGADAERYNLVILGDGYRSAELAKYHADAQAFVDTLHATAPFSDLWCALNVHRIDVASTDSGADDPGTCGDASAGSGATPRTYFDATFCGGGSIRRLLTCDTANAKNVARSRVPAAHLVLVIVNSPQYGGSGGEVATFSTHPDAGEIALHEMGHTAFGLADEYEYYAGCGSGEAGHDIYGGPEPVEPNVTTILHPVGIKWHAALSVPGDPLPTTLNANCAQCDPQPNPQNAGYVGAYAGARYFHCGCYRPAYTCRMRELGKPFCGACQHAIRDTLAPFVPISYQGMWWADPPGSESGWGINFAHQEDVIFATWFTYDANGAPWWLSMTARPSAANVFSGALQATRGPPFSAVPWNPATVTATVVGNATVTFADTDHATFAFTCNGVTRTKAITRHVFSSPVPTCRFGLERDLRVATNYQDLWCNDPSGSQSGWGINLTHQGNIVFATWFTYDANGAPVWMIIPAVGSGAGVYAGPVNRTRGPAFSAVPFDPSAVTSATAGTATFTFANGNEATFAYTVDGIAQTKTITRQVFRTPGTMCR